MTRPLPDPHDPEFAEHWSGLRNRQILVPRCDGCGRCSWPPRPVCPRCHSLAFSWSPVATDGTVHSWTIVGHRTLPGFEVPYAVLLVDVAGADGVRLLGGYTGGLDQLRVGMPVTARFQDVSDEVTLLAWARPGAQDSEERLP